MEVGNGAKKSPWFLSKIYSLSDIDCMTDLDQPFLIQTEDDYKRIFIDEKGHKKIFGSFGESPIWGNIFDKKNYEGKEAKSPWFLPQFGLLHGCIPIIGNEKHVKQYILILNGDYRGEIWKISDKTISRLNGMNRMVSVLTIMEDITYWGI